MLNPIIEYLPFIVEKNGGGNICPIFDKHRKKCNRSTDCSAQTAAPKMG